MRIINVPIENIPMRYSADWNIWFPREFDRLGVDWKTIYPGKAFYHQKDILEGKFLDTYHTNYFKSIQMAEIAILMQKGEIGFNEDIFFFHDLWNPAVEMLAYMRDCLDKKFKIVGILHAGTWDPHDFLSKKGLGKWAKHCEMSWLKIVDAVFVATQHHKTLIQDYLETPVDLENKIHVTGLPIFEPPGQDIPWEEKENLVVFPHRLDEEKQPGLFDKLQDSYNPREVKVQFCKSISSYSTKEGYYSLLRRSKVAVSFALQETWGIAMIESVLCGCVPLVPPRLSYSELYPECFKYSLNGSIPLNYIDRLATEVRGIVEWEGCLYEQELELLQKKFLLMGKMAIPNMIKIIYSLE